MVKWCKKHPVIVNVILWGAYLGCFFLVEKIVTEPRFVIHCVWDDYIPFVKYAIWPYLLWFPCILVSLLWLLKQDRDRFWKLSLTLITAMFCVLIFYVCMPNGVELRPRSLPGNDLSAVLVKMLWAGDNACNVCPSIHVMDTVLIDMTLTTSPSLKKHKGVRIISHVIAIAICLSTLFLKQHSVIDAAAGSACAIVVYAIMELLTEKEKNM